ncbi:hypothetical protein [Paractinoplanes brasiliensis]|uniref:Peptidase inhibitor family I36 n=1 Tax=Paractinoplanes brasiliensis TaxID=52695 RepID=A0A4R6J927_9ACTN|nr:hypothetical protein [Actinoplanes brasiliensis]TDO32114.1 hypothetical protein C8E87_7557 [Actinoplanes brasiliensis]GID28164.1 hypothetical protein Abr02nite_31470 [Actinoplanes brasiliensis]
MRPSFTRTVAVPAIATAAAVVGLATPAQASPYPCNPVGTAGNEICIQQINGNTGVNMWYWKRAGNPVTVRFSYRANLGNLTHWDNGWFVAGATNMYSFAWNNTNPPACIVGTLHVSNGEKHNVSRCR